MYFILNNTPEEFHKSYQTFYKQFDRDDSQLMEENEFTSLMNYFCKKSQLGKDKMTKGFEAICKKLMNKSKKMDEIFDVPDPERLGNGALQNLFSSLRFEDGSFDRQFIDYLKFLPILIGFYAEFLNKKFEIRKTNYQLMMGLSEDYELVEGAKETSIVSKFHNLGVSPSNIDPKIISVMTTQKALLLLKNSHPDSFTSDHIDRITKELQKKYKYDRKSGIYEKDIGFNYKFLEWLSYRVCLHCSSYYLQNQGVKDTQRYIEEYTLWSAIINVPKIDPDYLKKNFLKFAKKRIPINEPIEEEILLDLFREYVAKIIPQLPKSSSQRIIETYLKANEDRDIMPVEFAVNIYELIVNEADKKLEEYININYEQLESKEEENESLDSATLNSAKSLRKKKSKILSFKSKGMTTRAFTIKRADAELNKEVENLETFRDIYEDEDESILKEEGEGELQLNFGGGGGVSSVGIKSKANLQKNPAKKKQIDQFKKHGYYQRVQELRSSRKRKDSDGFSFNSPEQQGRKVGKAMPKLSQFTNSNFRKNNTVISPLRKLAVKKQGSLVFEEPSPGLSKKSRKSSYLQKLDKLSDQLAKDKEINDKNNDQLSSGAVGNGSNSPQRNSVGSLEDADEQSKQPSNYAQSRFKAHQRVDSFSDMVLQRRNSLNVMRRDSAKGSQGSLFMDQEFDFIGNGDKDDEEQNTQKEKKSILNSFFLMETFLERCRFERTTVAAQSDKKNQPYESNFIDSDDSGGEFDNEESKKDESEKIEVYNQYESMFEYNNNNDDQVSVRSFNQNNPLLIENNNNNSSKALSQTSSRKGSQNIYQQELERQAEIDAEKEKQTKKSKFMPVDNLDNQQEEFTKFDSSILSFKKPKRDAFDTEGDSTWKSCQACNIF